MTTLPPSFAATRRDAHAFAADAVAAAAGRLAALPMEVTR